MKAVLAIDCITTYADFNKPFTIVCGASDYQHGFYIIQDGRPVAYWSKSISLQLKRITHQLKKRLWLYS